MLALFHSKFQTTFGLPNIIIITTLASNTIDTSGIRNPNRFFQFGESGFKGRGKNYFEIILIKIFSNGKAVFGKAM